MKKKKRLTFLRGGTNPPCRPVITLCAAVLFFCLPTSPVRALDLTARPDNVFVSPGMTGTFNVLDNDDPGDCTLSALTVTIVSPPSHALLSAVNAAGQIRYRAVAGYTGPDELTYQIGCGSTVSTAKLYIHVNDLPDNITPDVCHIPPPALEWGIAPSNTNERNLSPYQTAVTGDIDNDGIVEILVSADPVDATVNGITRPSSAIAIYKGNDLSLPPKIINTVSPYSWESATKYGIVKTRIGGKDTTLIVVAESDRYLRAYNYNGGLVWTSSDVYHPSVYNGFAPGFADFDKDGIPEVTVCHKLFSSVDGHLLCAATTEFGRTSVAADLYGTGTLNFIAGNRIYTPDASLTALTLTRTLPTATAVSALDPDVPAGGTLPVPPAGGMSSVVDIDNDGKPEVIVLTFRSGLVEPYVGEAFIVVYDPSDGTVKASKYIPYAPMCGWPFVGDIDGDGYPEIVCISSRVNTPSPNATEQPYWLMHAYKYVPGNPVLQTFWEYPHQDPSGQTMMTLFDFNRDGISEIVYRDEQNLRIINGSLKDHLTGLPVSAPYNLADIPNRSGTGMEYPVVADVDGDGQAEILIVGGENGVEAAPRFIGPLWVYKSSDPVNSPWAAARKVWNQYAYNPVVVNSDLTVPSYPISPATAFYAADGTVNRPYNNFLQQGTDLNDEGAMLYLGPDLEFSPGFRPQMIYDAATDRLEITVRVHNNVLDRAGAAFKGPLSIDTYVYDRASGVYTLINTTSISTDVGVDETKIITYYINNYSSVVFPASYDNWTIVLNGKNNAPGEPTFYRGAVECNWWNNFASNFSFAYGERTICEGNTERVTAEPSDTYRYEWYDAPVGGNHVNTGDSYDVKKNGNPTQHYFLDTYTSTGVRLNSARDTVFVWLTPDSLVWTGGAGTADWHDHNNWKNPSDPTGLYARANVPRKCTDVLIPDLLGIYPDLDTPTDYSRYPASECANIWFEHGGEVRQNDVLDYDSAYVYLALSTDRWNMVTVPLQYHYPGDYYLTDPNPHRDGLFVYTRLFSRTNPETGNYIEADWTGEFNNPEIPMPAGTGLSAWLWDFRPEADILRPDTFLFPKHDLLYRMYDWYGTEVGSRPIVRTNGLGPKDNEHRFIYEPLVNASGEFPLDVTAAGSGKMTLAGNPFMSHLDFDAFYALNNARIEGFYQVLDDTGNYISYDAVTGVSTGTPALGRYIAPLQSFLVKSLSAFDRLYANTDMMRSLPGEKLRSSGDRAVLPRLSAEVTDLSTGLSNRTLLILDGESDAAYGETDVPKILPALMKNGEAQPVPVSIFTRSSDGVFLDVNRSPLPEEGLTVPLGIRTGKAGRYRLKITLETAFPPECVMYLADTESGREYELRSDRALEFEKETADEFLDGRFYLILRTAPTGMATPSSATPGIEAYVNGGMLKVYTADGGKLEEVALYDLRGRLILKRENPGGSSFETAVPGGDQIYVVRARSTTTSRAIKVYGKADY